MEYYFDYEYEAIIDKQSLADLRIRLAHLYTEIAMQSECIPIACQLLEYIDQTILRLNIMVYKSDILYLEDFVEKLSIQKGSDYSGLKPFVSELVQYKKDLYRSERSLKK